MVLILPQRAPRGWNSFGVQTYGGHRIGPGWNETVFRNTARAIVDQGLLAKGYDTIVIDGGTSNWPDPALFDKYGRCLPNPAVWPSSGAGGELGWAPLAKWTHGLGLKFGIWDIRGVPTTVVAARTPILGTAFTIDQVAWRAADCPPSMKRWCTCSWFPQYVGLNASHPAAAAFYASKIAAYASWGVDLLKWDCMHDAQAGFSDEEVLVVDAIRESPRELVLLLSPGDGLRLSDAEAVVAGCRATAYRATSDFHSGPASQYPAALTYLADAAFTAANFSLLSGRNGTFVDLDMIDLGADSPWHGTPAAAQHAAIWLMARSPLMFAGALPADASTLNLVANHLGLGIHAASSSLSAAYQGDCTCTPNARAQFACTLRNAAGAPPCVAVWHAALPGAPSCRALALLNLGNVPAPAVRVPWAEIGLRDSRAHAAVLNVTDVFGGNSSASRATAFVSPVATHGAVLLIVSQPGIAAEACVKR
jgi:alpha-galactosidase